MKKVTAILLGLLFVPASLDSSLAELDKKGSKNHPCFIAQVGKPAMPFEGHFYCIRYKLNKGAAEPGELKIKRNIQDALRKIGGKVVFDRHYPCQGC